MSTPVPSIPARDPSAHKGTHGTVGVLGGCCVSEPAGQPRMIGGPAIAARAALRAGAGLAKLLVPEPIANAAILATPEATALPLPVGAGGEIDPERALPVIDAALASLRTPPSGSPGIGVVAAGPGLGPPSDATRACVMRLISQDTVPIVLDADALNALATMPDAHRDFRAIAVLTPHPGEARRLGVAFGLDIDPAAPGRAERSAAAERLAGFFGCVCVLKSHDTVVADPVDARAMNAPPNPALATAGSGDVLTGVIAAFVAQFVRSALLAGERSRPSEEFGGMSVLDAVHAAAAAHARAGELWRERAPGGGRRDAGLLATELADLMPRAIAEMRAR